MICNPEDLRDVDALDLERRFLCSDGACVGTIGLDGLCKECRTPIDPREATRFEQLLKVSLGAELQQATQDPPTDAASDASRDDGVTDLHDRDDGLATLGKADIADGVEGSEGDDDSIDLAKRMLCPDGACIGVVGPDNRCKVCGTAFSVEPVPSKEER